MKLWICLAPAKTIHASQRFTSLTGFLSLKLPPPPRAATGIVSKHEDMPSTCKDQSDVALNSDKWVFEVLGARP